MNRALVVAGFEKVFRRAPAFVTRSPGRVNLIGEHTDYNDGLVMPAAIELATWTAIAPQTDRRVRAFAGNRNEQVDIDLDAPGLPLQGHWSDYVRGIAVELGRDGHRLSGAEIWFAGDVPEGAGLGSSAALEMSLGLALLTNARIAVDKLGLALAGQRAEHRFAGTRCGIMDEFVSAHGRAGHALMLDCRSLAWRMLPLPGTMRLVICDSGVKHQLAGGEYNVRRAQCEEGVAVLRQYLPEIGALRDVTPTDLARCGGALTEVVRRRCRHVVSENARVEAFAAALEAREISKLGRLMAESHLSLRDDYEVSCAELDTLVELAQAAPGVVGARMTGGGFGGSTINLVHAAEVEAFQARVSERFRSIHNRTPRILVSTAADGAAVIAA